MSEILQDNKTIQKAIEEKIDQLMNKLDSEKASKLDVEAVNKAVLNLKATLAARGEDAERDTKQYKKAHWNQKNKSAWIGELARSFEADNAWRKAGNPKAFREAFLTKATNVNEIDSGSGLGMLPTMVDSQINALITLYGVARRSVRVLNGIKGSIAFNSRNAYPTFARTVTASADRDDSTVTPNSPTFTKVTVQPLQSSGIAKVTDKLIYDSTPDVLTDVAEQLAIAAAAAEDTELFLGDGTATYGGFTGLKTASIGYANGSAGASVNVRTGSFTNFDPLLQMQQCVYPSVARSGQAKYHMTTGTFACISAFKASTAGLYFYDLSTNSYKIAGSEVEFNQVTDSPDSNLSTFAIAKVPVYYGDLSKAVTMAIGRDIEIKTLVELYAATNETGIRLTYDFGFGLILPAAVTRLSVVS